jgi:hypothetical protein
MLFVVSKILLLLQSLSIPLVSLLPKASADLYISDVGPKLKLLNSGHGMLRAEF